MLAPITPGSAPARRTRLLALLFANFVVFGAGAIVIGATVPRIVRDFGWTYLTMGAVLAAGSVGYFASTFACGLLVQSHGPRRVIVSTLLVQAAGLLLFGAWPSVAANLLASALIGLGEGGTEVVTNYGVVRLAPAGQSRLMNLMHAAFPVGAILASLGMGLMLNAGVAWQALFRGLAGLCAMVAVLLLRSDFGGIAAAPGTASRRAAIGGLLRQPLLVLLALIVLLYVGAEIGVSNWIAEYYVRVLGASPATAAAMVSVLWCGLLSGRLLLAALFRGHRQAPLLVALTVWSAACLAGAVSVDSPWVAAALFWATGVGFSAIYPVAIVLVGEWFPRQQGPAIGVVSTAGGIGSFGFPFVMSAVAQGFGVRLGFWFFTVLCVLMAVAAAAVLRRASCRTGGAAPA